MAAGGGGGCLQATVVEVVAVKVWLRQKEEEVEEGTVVVEEGSSSGQHVLERETATVGPHEEFARRFAEGIGKLAWSTLGDHRKKTR
ncbi:hypothetical protein BHE74_00014434 [Ensete ventricosum]|nr:hypothetical protein BHE74_00014434 [Ensete ventricosum]